MRRIFAYIVHKNGLIDDTAPELAAAAVNIDPTAPLTALVAGWGQELGALCDELRATYSEVWQIAHESLAYPNAEVVRNALVRLLPPRSVVLLPHGHFGMDLGPGLSVKLNAAYVSDVVGFDRVEGDLLNVVRQEYGGQVSAHVRCDCSSGAVISVRPGAFKSAAGAEASGVVIEKSSALGDLNAGRRYLETIVAEPGGVDIKKFPVLVSIGRGIQEKDNIGIAQELADALGAAVSCSRPVVDAKWMEKSRQVGSSGQNVKPKVYVACGISGSFQHLAGIKGKPFIVAINKNPKAPIFQVADVGVVDDILEFLPGMTAFIEEGKGAAMAAAGASR